MMIGLDTRNLLGAGFLSALLTIAVVMIQAGPAGGSSVETAAPAGGGGTAKAEWVPAVVPKPRIRRMLIPFGPRRKRHMAQYSKRHYGKQEWRLRRPRQIVQHVAAAGTVSSIYNTFATNRADPELGELPNVCTHYVMSASGQIYQLVNLRTRCRHVIGLNHVSIGIEHVGYRDGDLLSRSRQLKSSIRLTRWLRCAFEIKIRDVIGHAESLRSRFYRERIKELRGQTHGDLQRSSMRVYRKKLWNTGLCFARAPGVTGQLDPGRVALSRAEPSLDSNGQHSPRWNYGLDPEFGPHL